MDWEWVVVVGGGVGNGEKSNVSFLMLAIVLSANPRRMMSKQ